MITWTIALAGVAVVMSSPCSATDRSKAARAEFQRLNPCPATGKSTGPCLSGLGRGSWPLCAGGADHPSNMQWQTEAEAREKDREERRQCAAR